MFSAYQILQPLALPRMEHRFGTSVVSTMFLCGVKLLIGGTVSGSSPHVVGPKSSLPGAVLEVSEQLCHYSPAVTRWLYETAFQKLELDQLRKKKRKKAKRKMDPWKKKMDVSSLRIFDVDFGEIECHLFGLRHAGAPCGAPRDTQERSPCIGQGGAMPPLRREAGDLV